MVMKLFSPLRLGALELPNRIVMSAMNRSRSGEGKVPTELTALYYAQRAAAGLLVTESTNVSHQGSNSFRQPGLYTQEQADGWKRVTEAVHRAGGRIFVQLFHCGRQSHVDFQPENGPPVAPSAIAARVEKRNAAGEFRPLPVPRAIETPEIACIIEDFRQACELANEAGFDGVELHGGNGFLIEQFLRSGCNQRTDCYGGSPEKRVRFLIEVAEAAVAELGPGRVGVRLSPRKAFNDMYDEDPVQTYLKAVRLLNDLPMAYLHLTEEPPAAKIEASPVTEGLHALMRAEYRGTVILNGGYDRERAEADLQSGAADLISFGTHFISNPDLVERLRRNAPLNDVDRSTVYFGGAKGYTDYPTLGEQALPLAAAR